MSTTYYTDGGSHTVSSASGPVVAAGGSTVTFSGTFAVTGDDAVVASDTAAVDGVVSTGCTLSFDTVSVYGGQDTDPSTYGLGPAAALYSVGDNITVVNDLTCTGGDSRYLGGTGIYLKDPSALGLDLFEAYGGNASAGYGGAGLWIYLTGTSSVALGGGPVTLSGGTGTSGNGAALVFEGTGSSTLTLSGGPFTLTGILAFALYDTASVVINGSGLSWTGGNLTAFGQTGTLTGHIGTGTLVTVTVRCGGDSLTVTGSGTSLTFTA